MKNSLALRGRLRMKENVTYVLKDKNGQVKPIFQENWLFKFLMKYGIVSPRFAKIPLLLGYWSTQKIISNLVTNAGMAGVASRVNGDGAEAAFTYIAVGVGTTAAAAADTTLESETTTAGLSRAAATASRVTTDVTNDTAQLAKTFSATGAIVVTESGVLNAATAGVLLARQVFAAITTANGDSLTITWRFDID